MVTGMKTKFASAEASRINRQKRLEPEKDLPDGGKELPISVREIDHALDYALMLISRRRGNLRKTVP